MRDGCEPRGAFGERAAAQIGDAVFGDDEVDVGTSGRDRASAERRHDARMLSVRCRRRQRNDRSAAWRRLCAAHEIYLAADCAEIAVAGNFRIDLAREIDLDPRVDRIEIVHAAQDLLVVRVVGCAHLHHVISIGEVHQPAAPEQTAGDDASNVDAFARVRDDAFIHEFAITSEMTPLCTPRSRWLSSARHTATGRLPMPSCIVAPSGISAATCLATRMSIPRAPDRAAGFRPHRTA
jgi:hypothetical protein